LLDNLNNFLLTIYIEHKPRLLTKKATFDVMISYNHMLHKK